MSAPIKTFVVNHCIHTENPLHNPRKRLVFTGKYNQVNMISHDYIVVNRELYLFRALHNTVRNICLAAKEVKSFSLLFTLTDTW